MFLDQDNFIHKDAVLSYAKVFLREYGDIVNFFKYPRDIHNGKWDVSPFLYKGKWFKNHKCKKSLEKLKSLKHIFIASYSVFRSGTVVHPHVGYDLSEPVFRVHLPLIVPSPIRKGVIVPEKDCWLKVGGETRIWEVGKLLIFDDTVEHEAQNNTAEDRVILLMDFTRDAFKNV